MAPTGDAQRARSTCPSTPPSNDPDVNQDDRRLGLGLPPQERLPSDIRRFSPRGNNTVGVRVTDSSGATHSPSPDRAHERTAGRQTEQNLNPQVEGQKEGALVNQPITLEDGSVLQPPSTDSEGAIGNQEGALVSGAQIDVEPGPNTPGGAPHPSFPTTRAKTAVFALAGACAALFGASFAAAELTGDDERGQAGPAPSATSAAGTPSTPSGGSLALRGAVPLPGLREQPSPTPEPAGPGPAAAAAAHEPASSSKPAPVAQAPEPVAPVSEPVAPPPEPQPVVSPEPQPVRQPSPPAPQPIQPAAPPTDFYDSGG